MPWYSAEGTTVSLVPLQMLLSLLECLAPFVYSNLPIDRSHYGFIVNSSAAA
jgi:hypothetical protein